MNAAWGDVEARIRSALEEKLGETGVISRFHQHNDTVYLEVAASLGLERTAKTVEQALDSIGSFLRSAKIGIDVTIRSPWSPRWQSQPKTRAVGDLEKSGDELPFAATPAVRRRAGR